MRNNTELTAEQAKVLEEEEQLLLLVKRKSTGRGGTTSALGKTRFVDACSRR